MKTAALENGNVQQNVDSERFGEIPRDCDSARFREILIARCCEVVGDFAVMGIDLGFPNRIG